MGGCAEEGVLGGCAEEGVVGGCDGRVCWEGVLRRVC